VLDIPEYWIVDPLKEQVTVCTLLEGWYEAAEYRAEEVIASQMFAGLALTVGEILQG
jgi:Uma2 family endonuclease